MSRFATDAERAAYRQALDEILQGYDQLIELLKTGGQAPLAGHAYDPAEHDRELKLLEQLKQGVTEMKDGL